MFGFDYCSCKLTNSHTEFDFFLNLPDASLIFMCLEYSACQIMHGVWHYLGKRDIKGKIKN